MHVYCQNASTSLYTYYPNIYTQYVCKNVWKSTHEMIIVHLWNYKQARCPKRTEIPQYFSRHWAPRTRQWVAGPSPPHISLLWASPACSRSSTSTPSPYPAPLPRPWQRKRSLSWAWWQNIQFVPVFRPRRTETFNTSRISPSPPWRLVPGVPEWLGHSFLHSVILNLFFMIKS